MEETMKPCEHELILEASTKAPDPHTQRLAVLSTFAISTNNAKRFVQKMEQDGFDKHRLLTAEDKSLSEVPGLTPFQVERMVFNTRYQYQPFVIVMCQNTQEVQQAYLTAIELQLPIRVRSGGHDHAGECSGDNVVLIDVTGIKTFKLDEDGVIATIGAGFRFYELTPLLAEHNRMIAHGTCATVGLTGFIQGGGWGPWTRKYGMCCEYLRSATLVLGDGSVIRASKDCYSELFWALRGGGGMSYGIITEMEIETFALPNEIIRFELEWNPYHKEEQKCPQQLEYSKPQPCQSTLHILKAWEQVVNETPQTDSCQLLGTNLKIDALPAINDFPTQEDLNSIGLLSHHCLMYGYWEGTPDSLTEFLNSRFKTCIPNEVTIHTPHGANYPNNLYDHRLMSSWGRYSVGQNGTPFPPDYDAPAPHKITSRLVKEGGLSDEGYRALLLSLTSPLIKPENRELGLFSYVTLGAIAGDFYSITQPNDLEDVAFPYRNCQYTIQYQTWWNEEIKQKFEFQNNPVLVDVNRAMDWIDKAREQKIEGTGGAFISFKDPSIPTEIYFGEHYERLVKAKKVYAKDPFNHLRTNKTIF
ncbi:FAD-binding protein [Vibrio sp. 10N.222.52.B12]|nr:FAD-binding protein [Vibrio sp. 10N.222.52.B12]